MRAAAAARAIRTDTTASAASRLELALDWGMRIAAAGAAGATLAPIALSPDAFAACLPPAVPLLDVPCLGEAGLGLAAALGVAAGLLGALSAGLRGYRGRAEDRLLVLEVRSAASRAADEAGNAAAR
jgi:hypothetical protein